ncbi:hypothetical protein I7331_36495 [Frankia sp. AgB1.8]|nr:hypothetical protein [Frankia sp. AgB1.8]
MRVEARLKAGAAVRQDGSGDPVLLVRADLPQADVRAIRIALAHVQVRPTMQPRRPD